MTLTNQGDVARTKVFVSYSHVDREWHDRLVTHLAVLERLGVVEVWSDTRLQIGEPWRDTLNSKLLQCQVAVLLLSANFLASPFIQDVEVKALLENHKKCGLQLLPVIARPCAWRLVEWLETTQSRPLDGRALSGGRESDIDLDLAMLTYEVGSILGLAAPGAVKAMTELATRISAGGEARSSSGGGTAAPAEGQLAGRSWVGQYKAVSGGSEQTMQLIVESTAPGRLTGRIRWLGRTLMSKIEGEVYPMTDARAQDRALREVTQAASRPQTCMRFTDTLLEGNGSFEPGGDYRAVIQVDGTVVGRWYRHYADAAPIGQFTMRQEGPGS